jgi:chromosome segregation ATPase
MNKSLNLLFPTLISVLALLFTSCGSSPASLVEDMIDGANEITEILNGIESKEDYEDAKDDLKELGKKMDELDDKLDELKDELSKEEEDELKEEYEDKLKDAMRDMMKAGVKAAQYGFKMSDIK